jgi:four helix bundle protein
MADSGVRSYRDLLVWQKSMALVRDVYRVTRLFPDDERFGLISQMRRCAVSIPSNIAEGHGRHQTGDFIRFLRMANGSLYELQTQLEIARDLAYIDSDEYKLVSSITEELERMLPSLIRKLSARLTN